MLTSQRFNRLFESVAREPWKTFAVMSDSLLRDWESSLIAPPAHHAEFWASKDGLVFEVPLPGRNANDIEVSLEDRRLEVSAKAPAFTEGDARIVRSERVHGEFKYAWSLPFEPSDDGTRVNYQDGILRIEVQQAPAAARRTLAINAQ
jgi:HSP20 family molecular chaperone IbpA